MATTVEGCSSVDRTAKRAKRRRLLENACSDQAVRPIPAARSTRRERERPADSSAANDTPLHAAPIPHLPATFDVPEVEAAFISYCQLTSHAPCPSGDVEGKQLDLLAQVARYVRLAEFDAPDATRRICNCTLLEPLGSDGSCDGCIDAGSIYARLCATRLLTVAEERSVLKRMHYFKHRAVQILSSGDVNEWDLARAQGLISAAMWHRDLMVQANMRLIVSVVKRLPVPLHWRDELISDGVLALLRAVDKFDPSRGYRFCTYAMTVIRRECYRHVKTRAVDHSRYTQSALAPTLTVPVSKSDSGLEVETDRAHWLAWRDQLAGMMGLLTRREQVIIRSRYCLGSHRRVKTLKRLSAALKISKERVRQLEISALAKLRAAADFQ